MQKSDFVLIAKKIGPDHWGKLIFGALLLFVSLVGSLGDTAKSLARSSSLYAVQTIPDVKAYEAAHGKESRLKESLLSAVKTVSVTVWGTVANAASEADPAIAQQRQMEETLRNVNKGLNEEQQKTSHNPWALTEEVRKIRQSGAQPFDPILPPRLETGSGSQKNSADDPGSNPNWSRGVRKASDIPKTGAGAQPTPAPIFDERKLRRP